MTERRATLPSDNPTGDSTSIDKKRFEGRIGTYTNAYRCEKPRTLTDFVRGTDAVPLEHAVFSHDERKSCPHHPCTADLGWHVVCTVSPSERVSVAQSRSRRALVLSAAIRHS